MNKLIIVVVVLVGMAVYLNTTSSSTKKKDEAQPNAPVSSNAPPTAQMFAAVHANDYKKIDKLIKKDPQLVNKLHMNGGTFINCATTAGNLEMLNYLLDHGANPDGNAECGTTGLMISVRSGGLAMAETLLKHGATTDQIDKGKETVLDIATKAGNTKMVALLTKYGAKHANDLPGAGVKAAPAAKEGKAVPG